MIHPNAPVLSTLPRYSLRKNYQYWNNLSDPILLEMIANQDDMLDRLQSGLPNLKCVRLNNGSDYDGIIAARGEDTDDEDMDSDTGQAVFGSNSNYQRLGEGELHDAESESDSDSEMVDAHAVFDSDDDEEGYESGSSLSHEL